MKIGSVSVALLPIAVAFAEPMPNGGKPKSAPPITKEEFVKMMEREEPAALKAEKEKHKEGDRQLRAGRRAGYDATAGYTPCLKDYSFQTDLGCTVAGFFAMYDDLEEELSECEHWTWKELELHAPDNDPYGWFWDTCWEFWCTDVERFNMRELFGGADINLKMYFDGASPLANRQSQVTNGWDTVNRLSTLAQPIDAFEFGPAEHAIVEFPGGWDTENHIVSNFEGCESHAAYCCFVQDIQANDNNGNCAEPYDWGINGDDEENPGCVDADPANNTDLCFADFSNSPKSTHIQEGFSIFPLQSEGPAHCHGIAWSDNPLDVTWLFRGNTMFYVALADHLRDRGYTKAVAGSPMCACAEQMVTVSRSDCSEPVLTQSVVFKWHAKGANIVVDDDFSVAFRSCEDGNGNNNDLEAFYARLVREERIVWGQEEIFKEAVVGNCDGPTQEFVASKLQAYGSALVQGGQR